MATSIPICSLFLLVTGAVGAQHLRNAQALEPTLPGFISRQLLANAPSGVELDFRAQSDADGRRICKLHGQTEFPPESLNQSEDLRFCSQRGINNVLKFARHVPIEENRTFMPVFSSHSLTHRKKGVTHAVIWMHGGRMNANKYACDALNLTSAAGAAKHTLTIVPFFSVEQMTLRQWTGDQNASEDQVSVCWNTSQAWMSGTESAYETTTAFGVLDRIVLALQTEYADVFPDLERIVVTGFSAGCQLLQRWSFFSRVLVPHFSQTPVMLVLGSCGSYMYLDSTRPAESCSPLMHSGSDHTCDKFERPRHTECPHYDTYKYGLSLDQREHSGYLRSFAEYGTLISARQEEYYHKDIRFLFGDVDGCSCNIEGYYNPADMCFPAIGRQCTPNRHGGMSGGYPEYSCCDTYPGGTSNNVASTCEALLQGSNRLQRGLNYIGHLQDFYKRRGHTYRPKFGIFAGSHNSTAAYTTERFQRWVFGDMKGIKRMNGSKAGWSRARHPGEDPFAITWDGGDTYDDWSDDYDNSPPEEPQDTPQETVTADELDIPATEVDVAIVAAQAAAPAAEAAVPVQPTAAPQAPLPPANQPTSSPVTPPVGLPVGSPWVQFRGNWNCDGSSAPGAAAMPVDATQRRTDADCLNSCTDYQFVGFWPHEQLCRCYSACAPVGGETSSDVPNTVYQKRDHV